MTELLPPAEDAPAPPPPAERPVFAPDDSPRRDVRPSGEMWHRDSANGSAALRVLVVTQLLVFLAAGVVLGLATLPRRPVGALFVSVPVGEYEDPAWPVNPWADRDADLLADRFGGSGVKAFGFQTADRFRQLVAWLGGDGGAAGLPPVERRRPTIVHVTALAAVRGRGVYLLPADARADRPDGWVNVADILDAANRHGARHTLLLLDFARPAADPFNGNLDDGVSAALHAVLSAAGTKVPVLTACGPGEASLPADPAGASGFAFYLAEGLGGAADGFDDPRGPDGEVTVRELVRFVTARVDAWARRTHGRTQTPTLYAPGGSVTDFVLTRRPDWKPPDPAGPPSYPDWLRAAGAERDGLRASESARRNPLAFARLTAGFLAAEQRWLRPGPATRAEDAWRLARAEWGRATGRVPPSVDWTKIPAAADRFAVARVGVPDAPPDLTKALAALLVAKPEQEAEAFTAWAAAAKPHRVNAVGLVWAIAADTPAPTAEMVARWGRAVDAADPVKPLAETRALRAVAARESFRRQKLAAYPTGAVSAFFRAEDEFARLASLGPDLFGTVIDAATAARRGHRDGADLLFRANTAEQVSDAAAHLSRAADEYALARDRLGRARAARNALDTAALILGETLPGVTEHHRPPSAAWFAVADAATRVADGSGDVLGLVSATDQLVSGYGPAVVLKATLPDRRVEPRAADALRSLLAGSALGGSGRVKVWDALLADTSRLQSEAREREADSPPPPPPTDPAAGRKLRRAEASVRLLRLAGVKAADDAETLLRQALAASRPDDSEAAWERLAVRLRAAWLAELPAAVRAGGAGAGRVARAVTPTAARHRAWADIHAPPVPDSPDAYRAWVVSFSDAKDSR